MGSSTPAELDQNLRGVPDCRMHNLPFERPQILNVGPLKGVERPLGVHHNIGFIDERLACIDLFDFNLPVRDIQSQHAFHAMQHSHSPLAASSIPRALGDLVLELDESIDRILLSHMR